jgi:hypothetical protein
MIWALFYFLYVIVFFTLKETDDGSSSMHSESCFLGLRGKYFIRQISATKEI